MFEIIIAERDIMVPTSAIGQDAQAVACETCARLLADYKCSVHLFTDGLMYMRGSTESDFRLRTKQWDSLKQSCEQALDAIMKHRRRKHNVVWDITFSRNEARHSGFNSQHWPLPRPRRK